MSKELIFDIFDDRPIEEDTIILDTIGAYYDDIRILIEKWFWDGIAGMSCIVPLDDLKQAGMESTDFVDILKDKMEIEDRYTVKESEGWLFLNFNFETDHALVYVDGDEGPTSTLI